MYKTHFWIVALLMAVCILGCKDRDHHPTEASSKASSAPMTQSTAAVPATSATDKWLGKWIGPEGTYLVLSKNAGNYVVLINSLDGPATYEGTAAGEGIEFQRNGKTETIHAGDGKDTGMKWLRDKTNCLIVKAAEGYCRD
jgi:hypothetical protein